MAADQGVTDWVDISDFTPGIFDTYGPLLPDGAAQRDGTWRCYGHPSGGLHPLPRHVATTTHTITSNDDVPDYFPTTDLQRYQIVATEIVSPAVADSANESSAVGDLTQPDLLLYMFNWIWDEAGGASDYRRNWQAYRVSYYDSTTDTGPINDQFQPASPHHSRWFFRHGGTAVNIRPFLATASYRPVVAYADGSFELYHMFDDNLAGPAFVPQYMTAHQGRIINSISAGRVNGYVGEYSTYFGADAEFYGALQVGACDFADDNSPAVQVNHLTQGTNYGSGIGIIQTIDSNNLLIIRTLDGGYVARGDVTDPSEVVHLRTLPPTFDTVARPVVVDRAVIYGNRRGVWRVRGGSDQSENISPQLNGWFWGTEEMDPVQPFQTLRGKFAHAPPFILAPNNWVMDLRTNSWWRLEDPDVLPYAWYDVSSNGGIYASPSWINNTRTTLNHKYDPTLGAVSYSWRSQPINVTVSCVVNCREVAATIQGYGDVSFTLVGLNGDSFTTTATVASTSPKTFSLPVNLKAHDMELLIQSEGQDASTTAPIVHRVSVGYSLRESTNAAA
jgi:hypothetical protein